MPLKSASISLWLLQEIPANILPCLFFRMHFLDGEALAKRNGAMGDG